MAKAMKQYLLDAISTTPNTWFAESMALSVSFFSLLGICSLLQRYDRTPVVEWHRVNLNAAVSALATLSRGMMLLSTASCLGQLKWIWFNEKLQPLHDFEIINEAARGPSGALRLLFKGRISLSRYTSPSLRYRSH